jgi:ATP-binding cassette subfamily B protein
MRVSKYFNAVKNLLFIKILFAAIAGFVPSVMSTLIIMIVNEAASGGDFRRIIALTAALAPVIFWDRMQLNIKMPVDSLFSYRSREYLERLCAESVRRTGYETIESAQYQEALSHTGRYISRVSEIWDKILVIFSSVTTLVTLSLVIGKVNPLLIPVLAAGVLPVWRSFTRQYRERHELDKQTKLLGSRAGYLYSMISGGDFLKEERIFAFGGAIKERWKEMETEIQQLNRLQRLRVFRRDSAYRLLFYVTYLAALVTLISGALNNRVSIGELVALFTVMRTYQNNMSELFFVFADIKNIGQNYREIKTFHHLTPDTGGQTPPEKNVRIERDIELRNVFFKYPNRETFALCNINLKISKGETVFIAGLNGAGKSTLIKLITGLYRPSSGEVLYDGRRTDGNVSSNFAALFQDYSKFPFSIYENIALFGALEKDRIDDAVRRADLGKILEDAPDGGSTFLGSIRKNAINVSEGQWQRIALARALYKNSAVYIFDEPASALDPLAEIKIYDLYENALKGKTKIIISHRLGYARNASRIVVIDNGSIAEQGSFHELINSGGPFSVMFNAQKDLYTAPANGEDAR